MTPIQIILSIVFLVAIGRVVGRLRSKDLSKRGAALWIGFWLAAFVVILVPQHLIYTVAQLVGVGRGADLVVYSAIVLIFFIVFRLMVKQERLNRQLTELTRQIALNESKKL